MAEQTTNDATVTTPEPVANVEPANAPADLEAGQEVTQELPDFFTDEGVTEAELMGSDPEEEAKAGEEAGKTEAGDEKAGSEGEEAAKTEEDADKAKSDDSGQDDDTATAKPTEEGADDAATKKPPEGYVPYQALSEERTKRQALTQQLADLQAENESLKSKTSEAEKAEEFKVLNDAEFDELLEDDPREAIRYQYELQTYQREQANKAAQEDIETEQINVAASMIQQIVPGIYDEGNKAGEELGDFAVEHGLDPHFLTLLTDPRTKVMAAGSKGAVLMGEGAASVVSLLNNLRTRLSDPDAQREAIKESLREEITAEVMKKFKGGSASPGVLDVPGDAGSIPNSGQVLSEEEFARLPEAEQEKLLAGA